MASKCMKILPPPMHICYVIQVIISYWVKRRYDTVNYHARSVIPGAKGQAESWYDTERTIIYCIVQTLSLITNLSYL